MAAALALAGCGEEGAEASPEDGAGHIHGLGIDPADGALMVAAHYGLFRISHPGAEPERVSEHAHDLMGFTAMGAGHLLASGHPDMRVDLPGNLGLVESRDGGASWEPVSLLGEADFHALSAQGENVVGYDVIGGRLLVSVDGGQSWRERSAPAPLIDVALDPAAPERLVASSQDGLLLSSDGGLTWEERGGPPALLAWPEPGRLYRVDAAGAVAVSTDGGRGWSEAARPQGHPAAIAAAEDGRIYLALEEGSILVSADEGERWERFAQLPVGERR